ncbi:MAG: flagellar hook assembly protein FlgD [Halodesulfovibrio sp.]
MSYIDAVSYNNAAYVASTDTASSDLGQEDFLTLLVTQLENQDPLNPVEDAEMIAELAQFSSLEELESLNETMEGITSTLNVMTVNSAVSYLGQDVVAAGYSISKTDDGCTDVYFTPAEDCSAVTAHIYNEDGDIVASVDLGSATADEHTFTWDGLKTNGSEASEGTYYVGFEAYDADGEGVTVSSEVSGTVTGISSSDGTTVLELSDGRTVELLYVSKIISKTSDSSTTTQ